MSDKAAKKAELVRRCGPVIMRIAAACAGEGAGIAAYSCLAMAVTCWRKTGLTKKQLYALVDDLTKNDASHDPN